MPAMGISSSKHASDVASIRVSTGEDTITYSNIEQVSKGGFGKIYTATEAVEGRGSILGEQEPVCIKKIQALKERSFSNFLKSLSTWKSLSSSDQITRVKKDQILNEIKVLRKLKNQPFVIDLKLAFAHRGYYWTVTEYAKYRDLGEIARNSTILDMYEAEFKYKLEGCRYPVNVIPHLIAPIFEAVKYMHKKGIIHGDIKEDNIVLTERGIPKLCDFGGAVLFEASELPIPFKEISATEEYAAPEILNGEDYDTKIDTWSLGVTMLSMLYGQFPYKIRFKLSETDQKYFPNRANMYNYLCGGFHKWKPNTKYPNFGSAQQKLWAKARLVNSYLDDAPPKSSPPEWRDFALFVMKTLYYDSHERYSVEDLCNDDYILSMNNEWEKFMKGQGQSSYFEDTRKFVLEVANEAFEDKVIKESLEV